MNTKKLLFVIIANIFIVNNFGGNFLKNLLVINKSIVNQEKNIYGLTL